MPASQNSPNPIQPLSVGNVVSAGFRLYRSHLKLYFGIALQATLWQLVPIALLIPLPFLVISDKIPPSAWGLIIPIWIVGFVYCLTESIANSAVILRLAFGEVVSQPESALDARRYIVARKWRFFLANILYFLRYMGFFLLLYLSVLILGGIALVAIILIFGGQAQQNPAAIAILVLLGFIALVTIFSFLIWFPCRLFIFDVPLAIEIDTGAVKTISRSWELTKGHASRIFSIAMLGGLIILPLQIPAQIAVFGMQETLAKIIPRQSSNFTVLSFILSYILGLVINVFVQPLWQSIKAVIYCDLRSRREGLGLQLRDRTI
jgi:hypothetical protein